MPLEKTLSADIVAAMKAKDQTRLTALRMLKTALTNKNIEKGRDLDTAEELAVLSMLVKQRRDSIDQYTKGGRTDLADKEQAEIVILETYQPASASDEEIAAAVAAAAALAISGATGVATAQDGDASGSIDLGSLAAEFLALGLDPSPRKPGVAFEAPADAGEETPFAALQTLKGDEA